jgi:hypothetical protein
MTDEEWVANMPAHHLAGYIGVKDDVRDFDDEDDQNDGDDDDLIGVHDDAVYDDDEAAINDNNEEVEASEADDEIDDQSAEQDETQSLAAFQSFAQKDSGHLHKTSIRVDPPLTPDGKLSIKEAQKALEEASVEYGKLKEKAQDLEFKFKSAARISRHAREQKGEAEDAYYIAAKNARKAARHAENLAREAQKAAAKQAAHDRYNQVISAANSAASVATAKKASAAQTSVITQEQQAAPAASVPATTAPATAAP